MSGDYVEGDLAENYLREKLPSGEYRCKRIHKRCYGHDCRQCNVLLIRSCTHCGRDEEPICWDCLYQTVQEVVKSSNKEEPSKNI